jgi:hypothetical protein
MIKTFLLLITFILLSTASFSQVQNNYPIQTILKGDSVVIYTIQQSSDIDLMLANQRALSSRYRSDIEKLKNEIDSLKDLSTQKQQIIDSTSKANYVCDSVKRELYAIKDWLLKSSMDNSLLYFSWQDTTVRYVDLTVYAWTTNYQNGNLRLIRRGTNADYEAFKVLNYNRRESPALDWEQKYWEEDRPKVKKFPFEIKINEHTIIP